MRRRIHPALALAVAAAQAGSALAQYPVQPVMYVPLSQAGQPAAVNYAPAGVQPVAGWGYRPCQGSFNPPCPPPMPAQQPVSPAPQAPAPLRQPEAPAPKDQAPPPAAQAPAVDLTATADQGPAVGSGGYALATPMIGDFLGGNATVSIPVTGTFVGTAFDGSGTIAVSGTTTAGVLASIPNVSRGPFKIAENEFARPVDRVFAYYNYYRVKGQILAGGSAAVPDVAAGGPGAPLTPAVFPTANRFEFDLHRETFGFEKTFLGGDASIGVRIPVFQTNGSTPFSARLATPETGQTPGAFDAAFTGAPILFDAAELGDVSVVFKYAWVNTNDAVNTVGLVVTAPTGPALQTVDGEIQSTIFQPYVGFYRALGGSFFAQAFSAVAVPTDGQDVTIWFNDVGVGYRAGRFVPTLELHVNTPLNQRGLGTSPIGMSDQVVFTGGTHIFLTDRALFTFAVGLPVTGPQPYDVEAAALFNYRF